MDNRAIDNEKGYKKLIVWGKANELVALVYKYTKSFPRHEEYGITSQLRRATLSIAANIVEGQASSSKRDFLNFLNIANRSLVETEYLLEVSMNLGYLVKEEYEKLERIRSDVGVLLHGLSRSIKALL